MNEKDFENPEKLEDAEQICFDDLMSTETASPIPENQNKGAITDSTPPEDATIGENAITPETPAEEKPKEWGMKFHKFVTWFLLPLWIFCNIVIASVCILVLVRILQHPVFYALIAVNLAALFINYKARKSLKNMQYKGVFLTELSIILNVISACLWQGISNIEVVADCAAGVIIYIIIAVYYGHREHLFTYK